MRRCFLNFCRMFVILVFSGKLQAVESIKLGLNWKPEPEFGGFYTAEIDNFYSQAGLKVNILPGGSGTPTLQMLQSGTIDYGIVSADEILLAANKNKSRNPKDDIVALFAVYQTNPQGIMIKDGLPAKSFSEFLQKGKLLLWESGNAYARFLRNKYAKQFSIETAPYKGGLGVFLARNDVGQQCFVTVEPLQAKEKGVTVRTFLVADEGFNPYTTVLATRRDRLQTKKDEVIKIVQAVRKGWEEYLKNSQPTHKKLKELNATMTDAVLAANDQAQLKLIKPNANTELGAMSRERWVQLAQQLAELKDIGTDLKVEDLFVNLK